MDYPAATTHDLPKKIGDNLYVVYGSVKINVLMRFSRNMAIVVNDGELTLINAVRMNNEGLAALDALGTVTHVLRLGGFHGMDDRFYLDRYDAAFWSFPHSNTYPDEKIDHALSEGGPLPFPNAHMFEFRDINQPEGALLLKSSPGMLLVADSIQSYATPPHKPHTSFIIRLLTSLRGFPNETIVGPIWTTMMTDDRSGLRAEFERLLELDFDQVLSAHGTALLSGAHDAVKAAVQLRFERN